MDRPPSIGTSVSPHQGKTAILRDLDGELFEIALSAGCERFVGPYIRISVLDPGEGLVIFGSRKKD